MKEHMKAEFPNQVTIVGLGLMGGSLALAIKRFLPTVKVVGVDYPPVLAQAMDRGAIDSGYPPEELSQGLKKAELVFLSTPIATIFQLLKEIGPFLEEGTVVSDLGSTKLEICRLAQRCLPCGVKFVGGHPLTGSEGRGIGAADPFLFQNAFYVLTPIREVDGGVEPLTSFLTQLGAIVVVLDPERHDRIAAFASHLPQLIAVALVNLVGEKHDFLEFTAGGFRDLTRIASSPYGIWEDILKTNASHIREAVVEFIAELSALGDRLETGLLEEFQRARTLRATLPQAAKGFLTKFPCVRVILPDQPGALASVTGALAREGINIKDLALLRVREEIGGTFEIYLEDDREARRAAQILSSLGYEARTVEG